MGMCYYVDPMVKNDKPTNEYDEIIFNSAGSTQNSVYTLNHQKIGTTHYLRGFPILKMFKNADLFVGQFRATADFNEGDTFIMIDSTDGTTEIKMVGESTGAETSLPDEAFIDKDLVSVTIDGINKKLGFKLGSGGSARLNIFAQSTPPKGFEGIWLQTTDKFKNVQCSADVLQAGEFIQGSEYASAPEAFSDYSCEIIGSKIYFLGGIQNNSINVKTMRFYDVSTNMWHDAGSLPFESSSCTSTVIHDKIYYFGGYDASVYNTALGAWTTLATMPQPKTKFGCTVVNGLIYCIGGYHNSEALNTVNIYNPSNNSWTQGVPAPTAIYGMGCVAHDNKIYCIGGHNGNTILNTIYVYNTQTSQWSKLPTTLITPRVYFACIKRGNDIYSIAGVTTNKVLTKCEVFDIETSKITAVTDYPSAVRDFQGVYYDNKLICFCGYTNTGYRTSVVYGYDLNTHEWSFNANPRVNRNNMGVVVIDNKIYCIGGASTGRVHSVIEIYDTRTNTWTIGAFMPTPRYGLGCVVKNTKIYCIGGSNNITQANYNLVEVYDSVSNTWSTEPSMPTARDLFGCVIIADNIYCIGGTNKNVSALSSTEVYNTTTKNWQSIVPMGQSKFGFGCVSVGSMIYCIGGSTGTQIVNSNIILDTSSNSWSTKTPMPTNKYEFGCTSVGSMIYCIGGSQATSQPIMRIVEGYNVHTNQWTTLAPMLKPAKMFRCVNINNHLYCLGGLSMMGNVVVGNSTQIMQLQATTFPENTFVLQVPPAESTVGKYSTQLVSSKKLFGTRLLTAFMDAWIYKNNDLQQYPAYVGNGTQWIKFKN